MAELSSAPVLSTPAEHTFVEDPTPPSIIEAAKNRAATTDAEKHHVYEIARTARHVRAQRWRRVALQFPDAMLPDGPWVVRVLGEELVRLAKAEEEEEKGHGDAAAQAGTETPAENDPADTDKADGAIHTKTSSSNALETEVSRGSTTKTANAQKDDGETRLYILADTSYSACCVDEIAAEHADADAVVHYGRACLSPTSRLPVLHVFTRQALDHEDVARAVEKAFTDKEGDKIVIMADVMFQEHVPQVCELLRGRGYRNIWATEIVHEPAAPIPNRRIVDEGSAILDGAAESGLRDHHVFHISVPPAALLMTLSSRLSSLRIHPTPSSPYSPSASATAAADVPDPSMTPRLLQRRYALVIRLATASVIGILVNTLSVRNYMDTIATLKAQIAAAGKKSYTIVVGKLNPAKLANFAEIDGWVVVGCWESGLVEQEGMWKPVITPFELGLALQGDDKRVWTGEWWGGIEGVNTTAATAEEKEEDVDGARGGDAEENDLDPGDISDEESAPPEFDLRTGRLISNSRPMRGLAMRGSKPASDGSSTREAGTSDELGGGGATTAVAKRTAAGQMATIKGIASPGAEYLRTQRTWQGLGTDFETGEDGEMAEASTVVEEGRSGIARGYTVGEDASRS
ncbi:putative diphthamide synthesis protein-domain-containing protein [Microdochium bolleyi]|uniref:2-(3-amino-3-carboxypropyl)histidine synthase subunit 2 n=1 Tax=Microdochium bolleyi TaxID=196109 RepID=A0A136IPP3_9PEZI|nr:putative diphthamide synthesis protein-domain-containing protein [Microdochium bolleyi]